MSDLYGGSFFEHFGVIRDARQEEKVKHRLVDVLFIAVCAFVCDCNDWEEIALWAEQREPWLRQYIALENGIPSCWTFERVFDIISPKQFELCFTAWMADITRISDGVVVAIDGKTMRGTAEKAKDLKGLHIVSAWCSQNSAVLGQVKTSEKSNEITAIPELLDMLFIKGAVVTIDAMGCQKKIAKKIVEDNKADYVLSLKENQQSLYEDVRDYFLDEEQCGFEDGAIEKHRTLDHGHGRIDERVYYYSTNTDWLATKDKWPKLNGIGMVVRRSDSGIKQSEERAFYIGSLKGVEPFADAARRHWGVESMHWSLDVTFREDACRVRKGKAAENLAMLKRLALNMVKKDETRHAKRSLRKRRFAANLDTTYLEHILSVNFS